VLVGESCSIVNLSAIMIVVLLKCSHFLCNFRSPQHFSLRSPVNLKKMVNIKYVFSLS
jgi:hypothetical protein